MLLRSPLALVLFGCLTLLPGMAAWAQSSYEDPSGLLEASAFAPAFASRAPGAWSLSGPVREERWAFWRDGLLRPRWTVEATVSGAGSLLLANGTDGTATRGVRLTIPFGAEGVPHADRLTAYGAKRVGRALRSEVPGGAGPWRLKVDAQAAAWRVAITSADGTTERWRLPHPGVPSGRPAIGLRGGRLQISEARFDGQRDSESRRRAKRLLRSLERRGQLPHLPDLRALPIGGPLERVSDRALLAGLDEQRAERLREARARVFDGQAAQGLVLAEALLEEARVAVGPAYLVGWLRLSERGDARGAARVLERAEPLGDEARLLRADCALLSGDLPGATALFGAVEEGTRGNSGLALIAWLRGEAHKARELAATVEPGTCRRTVERTTLLAIVLALDSEKAAGLHRHELEGLRVLSDVDVRAARRVSGWASGWLAAVRNTLRLPAGGYAPPLIVACRNPLTFHRVARRLGDLRTEDTVGICWPAARLVVFLDDDDPRVSRYRLQHELWHHVARDAGVALPVLLEEGVAELMAATSLVGTELGEFGRPTPGRFARAIGLARGPGAPRVLARMNALERSGDHLKEDDYALGWLAALTLSQQGKGANPLALRRWLDRSRSEDQASFRASLSQALTPQRCRKSLTLRY